MNYQDAQAKLIARVRDRIQNGELTERGLAGLIGISQPHVHNVLKGVRNLSPEVFDAMLEHFQMSLLDLANLEDLEATLRRRRSPERTADVPFLDGPVGPGMPWPARIDRRRRFPLPSAGTLIPPDLVMAHLTYDRDMFETTRDADIALLDLSEQRRRNIVPEGLYAVSLGGDALLRYIRPGAHVYYLANDVNMNKPLEWQEFRTPTGGLLEVIKARVRWLGRERGRNLPMAQRGWYLYDPISR